VSYGASCDVLSMVFRPTPQKRLNDRDVEQADSRAPRTMHGTRRRHLAETTERPVVGGDAGCRQCYCIAACFFSILQLFSYLHFANIIVRS